MKKHNWLFIGECVIVIAMLAIIAVLVKDEKQGNFGRKTVHAVIEVKEKKEAAEVTEELVEDVLPMTSEEDEIPIKEEIVEKADDMQKTEIEKVNDATASIKEDENNDIMEIVVFGDSIWADGRGTDGISEQIMEQLDVKIYNCAIGGTAAALEGETQSWDNWSSRSFNGMMYVATDIVSADDLMPNDAACEVIKNVDFEEVDYVIVSYGLNDYFSDIPIYPQSYYDLTSYVGALRHGIQKLREEYPNLEFIVTSPTYCRWFVGERQFELGAYVEAARSVAEEMDAHFLDMYHAFSKDTDKKMEYLEDGVHLTAEGRWLYSRSVIDCLKQIEKQSDS